MSEKIWAQENHDLALAGPDTPKQEWESSGAYNDVPARPITTLSPIPDPTRGPWSTSTTQNWKPEHERRAAGEMVEGLRQSSGAARD